MENFISLNSFNINTEHICCAFSDKKCAEGYQLKKEWLKKEFETGYKFNRLNARAKVFIEYGPAELGWAPIIAPGYLLINCFWVSGQYKRKGYGKALLKQAIESANHQGKNGLVTIVGTSKFNFMSDTKWLLKQGFETCEKLPYGFSLLVLKTKKDAPSPKFMDNVTSGECESKSGLVVYYSNRCPFTEYHVKTSMVESAQKRNIPLQIIKIETMEQAQSAPTPATIFSLFYNGKFITTDLSICLDSRFNKIIE